MIDIEKVKSISCEFFEKMLVSIDSLEVNQEGDNIFYVKIKTTDSSIMIGYSGKNLEDIRVILKHLISKISGEFVILHLEVNDYLSKKDDKLFDFVSKKIEFVESTGKEVVLPYFNAYDRKKIHSYISELNNKNISTQSIGEGENRKIHIFKQKDKLTIDIFGSDI